MGGIREFNCACLIVSPVLALLLNTSRSLHCCVLIGLVSTVVTPLVYYKNTQPIVRSQTRENTRLHATTACKANRGVFLYSSGQQPSSFSCSAAATVLPAELWSSLHLLFPAVQQPQSCLLRCGAGSTFSFRATPPPSGPAAALLPSSGSSLLRKPVRPSP